ncbi:MAG: sulfotransferase family 2 domain-containing protein [Leptolyngbyaceae cyanobacterium MO_188.B28]|nr:sulfotransferase family 2 domain-containing protein [Leptolyngbyaceae cyanobacterium MO_188.B28]
MIINHKYKFIFLKTRKTAGTSIEIALSKFCDRDDIITPITEGDEKKRQELGFIGPQNYKISLQQHTKREWFRYITRRERKRFFNHIDASQVRKYIGADIWKNYFKFCFERDPFDKAISHYYWSTREPRPPIEDYLNSSPTKFLSNWDIYAINDHIAADFVGRYENLTDDLATIVDKLGLPEKITLPRAKGEYRKNRSHYSTLLNASARSRIEIVCAKEIAAFNYHWTEPSNQ